MGYRPDPADRQTHILETRPARIELDQRRHADKRNDERAAMPYFLEAAAVSGEAVALDGDKNLARFERSLSRTADESVQRHAPTSDGAVAASRELHLPRLGEQRWRQ